MRAPSSVERRQVFTGRLWEPHTGVRTTAAGARITDAAWVMLTSSAVTRRAAIRYLGGEQEVTPFGRVQASLIAGLPSGALAAVARK
jgi:hypothetical protein